MWEHDSRGYAGSHPQRAPVHVTSQAIEAVPEKLRAALRYTTALENACQ